MTARYVMTGLHYVQELALTWHARGTAELDSLMDQ